MLKIRFLSWGSFCRGSLRHAAKLRALLFLPVWLFAGVLFVHAQKDAPDPCPRRAAGSEVPEPQDLRSEKGVLQADLKVHNYKEKDGATRYCYLLSTEINRPRCG